MIIDYVDFQKEAERSRLLDFIEAQFKVIDGYADLGNSYDVSSDVLKAVEQHSFHKSIASVFEHNQSFAQQQLSSFAQYLVDFVLSSLSTYPIPCSYSSPSDIINDEEIWRKVMTTAVSLTVIKLSTSEA